MTCEQALEPLHDRLDGPLAPSVAAELDAHLAGCPACRALAHELQQLTAAARALPREIQPERDLWPGIEAAVAPRVAANTVAPSWRALAAQPRWLAAAAILLVLGSSGLTAGWMKYGPSSTPPEQAWQHDMTVANAELAAALEARRGELDPETLAVVESNLKLIDQAIAETAAALAERPEDAALRGALVRANEQKLTLLRRALALPKAG